MIQFLEMLEFCRPAGSVYEQAFIDRYIKPLGPQQDAFGNLIVDIGKPRIIWSSHTDTVHNESKLQRVIVDRNRIVRVKHPLESNCLGADCTTGVYIMMKMIEAGVEGRYIFHRDEEAGLNGSRYIAKNTPDVLKGIEATIAFDRKNKGDIITWQGHKTASNDFAESLAAILDMGYKPSTNGMGTDTKSYSALVPECTNISVGYFNQHTNAESQDLFFLEKLIAKMVTFDSSSLVIKRTPEEPYVYKYQGGYGGRNYSALNSGFGAETTVFDLCRSNPFTISRILEKMGWDFDTLENAIKTVQSIPSHLGNDWDDTELWGDAVSDDGSKLPDFVAKKAIEG